LDLNSSLKFFGDKIYFVIF